MNSLLYIFGPTVAYIEGCLKYKFYCIRVQFIFILISYLYIVIGHNSESIWRQIGFVRFNIPAVDVIRLLLPDVIVFLGSLITLCVNVYSVRLCRSGHVESESSKDKRSDHDKSKANGECVYDECVLR